VVFDAGNGKVRNSRSWKNLAGEGAVSGKLGLLSADQSNFLAAVHDRIFRFSPDLNVQAERLLSNDQDPDHDAWGSIVDPKGRSAMLMRFTHTLKEQDSWISPTTLLDKETPATANRYLYSYAELMDRYLVFNNNPTNPRSTNSDLVFVQERDQQPHPLCDQCTGVVLTTFGSGYVFLISHPGASYRVADLSGNIILEQKHGDAQTSRVHAAGASDANRIALWYVDRDIVRFAISDTDARKEIWNYHQGAIWNKAQVGSFHVTEFVAPTIALSPDGHKLAILMIGLLRIYAVP
jgi:hypothetical protein